MPVTDGGATCKRLAISEVLAPFVVCDSSKIALR
jgi:hypothetical protein